MESSKTIVIILLSLGIALGSSSFSNANETEGSSTLPSETQMIQRRLLTDVKELKSEVKKLTRTINKLKSKIKRLRQTNRRQENHIQNLKSQRRQLSRLLKKLEKIELSEFDSKQGNKQPDHAERSGQEPGKSDESEAVTKLKKENKTNIPVVYASNERKYGVWRSNPNRDYLILDEPLEERIHYVTDDETILTLLAHKFYHDARYYMKIYEVNKDKLPKPDVVPPGVKLTLPPLEQIK